MLWMLVLLNIGLAIMNVGLVMLNPSFWWNGVAAGFCFCVACYIAWMAIKEHAEGRM